jgi:hypothetical protein
VTGTTASILYIGTHLTVDQIAVIPLFICHAPLPLQTKQEREALLGTVRSHVMTKKLEFLCILVSASLLSRASVQIIIKLRSETFHLKIQFSSPLLRLGDKCRHHREFYTRIQLNDVHPKSRGPRSYPVLLTL